MKRRSSKSLPAVTDSPSFPIVGLGASAGGLEALESFIKGVPADSGMAYVVVQHLDPTHKAMLAELLQRCSAIPVVQIKDRMKAAPNRVFVIPPDCDLSIDHGMLRLQSPAAARGLRLPIDFFFRSLAHDLNTRAIGVILSGMGADGQLGVRAIKENAGAVFVQSPETAKFDSMPRNAIETGVADAVAPAEELPGRIAAYLQPLSKRVPDELDMEEKDRGSLDKIIVLLRGHSGHDFANYKKNTLYRRIERRMLLHKLARIEEYHGYLRKNPAEAELLFKELLIGVTNFFRDPAEWELLRRKVIPGLLTSNLNFETVRAWVPGCSTGEEAYGLAMVFKEAVEQARPPRNTAIQIFATDLDQEAIDKARAGIYPVGIAADVSEARLRRFFVEDERGYRVSKEIRDAVIFARQNIIMDPPFTRMDIVSCRNLFIYLESELQKKLIALFHYSLNPGGILFQGSSETVGEAKEWFTAISSKSRIYRRVKTSRQPENFEFPVSNFRRQRDASASVPPKAEPNLQTAADHLLLQDYAPPAVLVTSQGNILYISGKTGKYLEPAAGKANLNLFAMARKGLSEALSEAFPRAVRQKSTVTLKSVQVASHVSRRVRESSGDSLFVDVAIHPLTEPEAMRGLVMVVFSDLAVPAKLPSAKTGASHGAASVRAELKAAILELQRVRNELHEARTEMQVSQEELKSTNEELQSINEELQSANEELTTSKEEMQSMNEELQTVNGELQAKVTELSRASGDMNNLLNSTDIATLFLDIKLNIRRFTTETARIIKLIPGDVGRPISDLASALDYPSLISDVKEVLASLVFKESQISTRDGRWFAIRIMPYRTEDNRIDGVVITFSDITTAKNLETDLKGALHTLEERFTTQSTELDHAKALELVLQKTQSILEKRVAELKKPIA